MTRLRALFFGCVRRLKLGEAMDQNRHIQRAAAAIAAVLEDLEFTTGKRVESIGLYEVDVTTVSSDMKTVKTGVAIQLQDPSRREWL